MASNGNLTSNNAGASYPNPCNLYFEWWVSDTNQAERWTEVSFSLKAGGGKNGYWTYYNNILLSIAGEDLREGRIKAYNGQELISSTKRFYHDGQGNCSFGVHIEAGIYARGVNSRGDGQWSLDPIAVHHEPAPRPEPRPEPSITKEDLVQITYLENFCEDQDPSITLSNPRGFAVICKIEADGDTDHPITRQLDAGATSCTFRLTTQERQFLHNKFGDRKQMPVRFWALSVQNGREIGWSYNNAKCVRSSAVLPFVSGFYFNDLNHKVKEILGKKHVFIRGVSRIELYIPSDKKSKAYYGAHIVSYGATFAGMTASAPEQDGDVDLGSQFGNNFTSGHQHLDVYAKDSRGNVGHFGADFLVLDYSKPTVRLGAERRNSYSDEFELEAAGEYSPLELDGTAKNAIESVEYRYKEESGSWSDWISLPVAEASDGRFRTKKRTISLPSDKSWKFEARVTDKVGDSVAVDASSVSMPIFRIGVDGYVYNNEQPLMPSHIGQVIMSTTLKTASQVEAIYRGKWEAWGQGRTPVGVDPDDYDFSAPNKRGGKKRVTLTLDQIPSHSHPICETDLSDGDMWVLATRRSVGTHCTMHTEPVGGGESHENMPPYQSIYMWVRVE